MTLRNVCGFVLALGFLPTVGSAATQYLNYIVVNPNTASGDYFGVSADIFGNTGIVGATANDLSGGNAGAAFVFNTKSGELLHTLTNPTPRVGDQYGKSVAVNASMAIVGAFLDDTYASNSGSAYVYDLETGDLLRELANPDPQSSDNFGASISVAGDVAAIGAIRDNDGANSTGSVHLYDLNTGELIRTLNNPIPMRGDQFGVSVSISGNIAVVGANRTDDVLEDGSINRSVGKAHVFNIETGELLQTLDNPTPDRGDQFGSSVATNGTVALVGAARDDTDARNTGKVYVFDVVTGALIRTIDNPTPGSGDNFGNAIDISGNSVLIGAVKDDEGANNTGAAHLFDLASGALLQTFANPLPVSGDLFGGAVAIDGGSLLIGSSKDDTSARDSGSAFFYSDNLDMMEPAAVPLPASASFLLVGFLALGSLIRRRH